ncbi:NAD(P)/FAD-dependent oxidoreductase [Desulfuromonas carbonis]|uniref:NAD(P)/FAD-dependent oxidoreductase n=1 Tax=Desulfuromonas sp. DDH964 TaxID=1823759 RepID=UPI00078DF9A0|nr:NAD(P)/FAD-dependent oxidoreductase [Desulfuromonas sp. DDH964]AMV73252.1 sulfite reductase, assimilatory [Desulfuromonas sp. DDH964]
MKQDIPEKGAIIQRDREHYGVAPHIPAGLTDAATLRRIAAVAERYQVAQIKLTSAQRIALLGFAESDLDAILADLGEAPGATIGLCVRSVKVCPGTDHCKRGQQDSTRVGLEIDRRYHGMQLPWKFKMAVSGCMNDCGEACIKDVGLIGTPKGWHLMVGGNGGSQPRLAHRLLEHLPDDATALAAVDHVVNWFRVQQRKCRLGKFIDEMGFAAFREEVLQGWEE